MAAKVRTGGLGDRSKRNGDRKNVHKRSRSNAPAEEEVVEVGPQNSAQAVEAAAKKQWWK